MIKKLIRLILSRKCPCYKMGYHKDCDFNKNHKIGAKK